MRTISLQLLLSSVSLGCLITTSQGFSLSPSRAFHSSRTLQCELPQRPPLALFAKETLQFGVTCSESSEKLSGSPDKLSRFFQSSICTDHFLSGGGTKPCRHVPLDDNLSGLWNLACRQHNKGAPLPKENDTVIATENKLQFPGLRMENTVYSGLSSSSEADNQMDFVLIAEEQKVYGPRPVVWLYHKITGGPPPEGPHTPKARAHSKLLLTANQTIVVDASVQITVEFPSTLLKLMPTSKAKMEEQGSASIAKAVIKDVSNSIQTVGKAYQRWNETVAVTPANT